MSLHQKEQCLESLKYIKNYLKKSTSIKEKMIGDRSLLENIENAVDAIEVAYKSGSKLLLAGNGGSAGDAQHIAAEFVSRFYDRPGLQR